MSWSVVRVSGGEGDSATSARKVRRLATGCRSAAVVPGRRPAERWPAAYPGRAQVPAPRVPGRAASRAGAARAAGANCPPAAPPATWTVCGPAHPAAAAGASSAAPPAPMPAAAGSAARWSRAGRRRAPLRSLLVRRHRPPRPTGRPSSHRRGAARSRRLRRARPAAAGRAGHRRSARCCPVARGSGRQGPVEVAGRRNDGGCRRWRPGRCGCSGRQRPGRWPAARPARPGRPRRGCSARGSGHRGPGRTRPAPAAVTRRRRARCVVDRRLRCAAATSRRYVARAASCRRRRAGIRDGAGRSARARNDRREWGGHAG